MTTQSSMASFYNETYKRPNYFRYQSWLYEPYVSSLIAFSGLKKGASVLDIGCGQGFFSYLFSKQGMKVHGVDMSETGISVAQETYGKLGITFAVSDVETVRFQEKFDCIFVRSCSLYNTPTFPRNSDVTNNLLKHLKVGGTFIFAYNSNFSSKESPSWRYHSFEEVRQHFVGYPGARIFFLNKFTTCLLHAHSFTSLASRVNVLLSKVSGVGGDLVCILQKGAGPIEPDL